jgi:hypothetical protein
LLLRELIWKVSNKLTWTLVYPEVPMSDAQGANKTGWLSRHLASEQAWLYVVSLVSNSAAVLLVLVGFGAAIVLRIVYLASDAIPTKLPVIFCIACVVLGLVLAVAGRYFHDRWEKWQERLTVEEAKRRDPRPQILYLRPFKADRVRFSTLDQRIRFVFKCLYYLLLYFQIVRVIFRMGTRKGLSK